MALLAVALGGCAMLDDPTPLTGADIAFLAKSGKSAPQIIEELRRSGNTPTSSIRNGSNDDPGPNIKACRNCCPT